MRHTGQQGGGGGQLHVRSFSDRNTIIMDLTQRSITSGQRRNTKEEENVIRDIPETIPRPQWSWLVRKKEREKCTASTLASLPPSPASPGAGVREAFSVTRGALQG